ncbi:MAG: SPOR domain-containing protein [Candidatus Binatia bacterium]
MAARQTRRQLQFSGFEMTLLAVSFVISVTGVFFLGLFVGKRNASHHAPVEDRVARIPVDDFTKYKRPAPLTPPPKEERAAAENAPAAKDSPAAAPAVVETAKAAPEVAAAAPAAKADSGKPADAEVTAKEAAAAKAKAEAAAKAAAAKAKEAEKEEAEPETGRGYTVQILATRKQADADALVRKLKSRGYAAYIKKVSDGAGAWYRVRVGSYGAFSEARVMADRCRRDLGLGQAFVSTE